MYRLSGQDHIIQALDSQRLSSEQRQEDDRHIYCAMSGALVKARVIRTGLRMTLLRKKEAFTSSILFPVVGRRSLGGRCSDYMEPGVSH
ncbi:protein of unknown function [Nitrospira japonica]|uniref:Uncharacterized protein n=1 Tax=Nitrospira japonica TaxID=1325564 RepID=A0A1W1I2R0_9BACT|nr:protein of unknown function [Nitrospira japonica]